jgi:3-hydroxyisobutyrate dehydrogenase-like beta-hydroxyacid dehydrogenase
VKLAFIGLGVMGAPMAGHLAAAGHQLTVYNRTRTRAEDWVQRYGGLRAITPAEAACGADIVLACVGNDDDVRQVTTGPDGCFRTMHRNSLFIDHTTASAELAKELAAAGEPLGIGWLDAPVSGGQAGAEAGKLSIMVGGSSSAFAYAQPVLRVYGATIVHMGESGSGQLAKMANQICIAGVTQGLAEALAFAQRAGLDGTKLLSVISKGAAGSWMMENRGKTMLEDKFDFGFAIDLMIKDLQICLDEAARNGATLPNVERVIAAYRALSGQGEGRYDVSALIHSQQDKPQ